LNRQIFNPHDLAISSRKHLTKNIFGLLLIVPEFRADFVTQTSLTQRYLVIEHLFENEILEQYNMKGENILQTNVFEISGNKNDFSHACVNFERGAFREFQQLFDKFEELNGEA